MFVIDKSWDTRDELLADATEDVDVKNGSDDAFQRTDLGTNSQS